MGEGGYYVNKEGAPLMDMRMGIRRRAYTHTQILISVFMYVYYSVREGHVLPCMRE
jgi:hypothetical protein